MTILQATTPGHTVVQVEPAPRPVDDYSGMAIGVVAVLALIALVFYLVWRRTP